MLHVMQTVKRTDILFLKTGYDSFCFVIFYLTFSREVSSWFWTYGLCVCRVVHMHIGWECAEVNQQVH